MQDIIEFKLIIKLLRANWYFKTAIKFKHLNQKLGHVNITFNLYMKVNIIIYV